MTGPVHFSPTGTKPATTWLRVPSSSTLNAGAMFKPATTATTDSPVGGFGAGCTTICWTTLDKALSVPLAVVRAATNHVPGARSSMVDVAAPVVAFELVIVVA